MARTEVIILGGGFGGLNAAKILGNTKIHVDVIDKTNHHLFQPLLYQVASASLEPADIAVPIRELLSVYPNITVLMGDVERIDLAAQEVILKNGDKRGYEYLVVALGASHSYFGKDAWEQFAPGLKTLNDALKIREKILLSFEKAERCDSAEERAKYLNFVIIGGGPTGVEMAGAIAEIAYETMIKNFRNFDVFKTKIYLVEGHTHVLAAYPPRLGDKAKDYLHDFRVNVITGKRVSNVTEEGVTVDGTIFIPAENIVWAAGNQASSVLKTMGAELDNQGRAQVSPDLSLPGHPEVFVIGDAACTLDSSGKPLPGLAPVAVQQGRYVAHLIREKLPPEKRPPFRYLDKGSMATIGKTKAVGMFKKLQFSGLLAWMAWCFIHIFYLIGFRNRLSVLLHWLFSYFTSHRGARLIFRSIDDELQKRP
jgi:NADH dehydrogenase